jgi:hypothetical protein
MCGKVMARGYGEKRVMKKTKGREEKTGVKMTLA